MNAAFWKTGVGTRYAGATAAGLIWAGAFPKIGVAGLAWVVPGLLLAITLGQSRAEAFRLGYVAGLAHFLASLYWLLFIPVTFAPIVGWLALSAFLALYPATWVWLCWRIYPVRCADGDPGWGAVVERFVSTTWLQRTLWAVACAAMWVALEMLRARLLGGFPWNVLGASQYRMLPLIQISTVTGVYGVSFLVVWFSVSLMSALWRLAREPERQRAWVVEVGLPMLAVALVVGFGMRALVAAPGQQPTIRVALVQPSIPQRTIWNPRESGTRFQQLLALSEQALSNQVDLLIWPEAAVPSLLRWDTNLFGGTTLYDGVTNLVRRHQVWLVLGADDAEPSARAPDGADYYNSSFLIDPAGRIAGIYRKQRLVIFGEFVPLARWLPFLRTFTGVGGDFAPGAGPVTFHLNGLQVKTSVLICFEDIFPHGGRLHAQEELDFLINITNDGWFGESAAQWQQAANAVFRAVENGLPLVRCANNGLTCWIDAQGRMEEVYFPGTKNIYRAGFKLANVPVRAGTKRPWTFYRTRGDWFGWGCVAIAAAAVVAGGRRRSWPPPTGNSG